MKRRRDDNFIYYPNVDECADAAAPVFAANRWRWTRCGIPSRREIIETLDSLRETLEDGFGRQESGRLVYDRERGYGHMRPRV